MNIAQAKDFIKDSVQMYLKKDEFGDYRIPIVRQRPIFLVGAPGIGKSAIMEQIAGELGIALVSYSMTHHTRQSALGLPFIKEKDYGGTSYDVSEYTMSEIISSIYETMEASGLKEGILFLDEINCVSETLYPSMLQFLQFKTFGRHRVPDGWVIVTAGNPPQYNKSVREFDVVTLDRLKVLHVNEDYDTWKKYAAERNIHSAITGFLDGDKDSFYHIETTAEGSMYVTARGWEDLSEIIHMYEENNIPVTEELVSQYLQCDEIVREFVSYYELYRKYRAMFKAEDIVSGKVDESVRANIVEAPIDERIALVGILLDYIKNTLADIMNVSELLKRVKPTLSKIKESEDNDTTVGDMIRVQIDALCKTIEMRDKAGTLTATEKRQLKRIIAFYELILTKESGVRQQALDIYGQKVSALSDMVKKADAELYNAFIFVEEAFGKTGNEMLIFVTELTINQSTSAYLAMFGSKMYDKYNELLMVGDKSESLHKEVENIFS